MYANVGKTDFLRFVATEAEYLCICLWGNCASSSVLLLFPLPPPPHPPHLLIDSYSSLYILGIGPVSFKRSAELIPGL